MKREKNKKRNNTINEKRNMKTNKGQPIQRDGMKGKVIKKGRQKINSGTMRGNKKGIRKTNKEKGRAKV